MPSEYASPYLERDYDAGYPQPRTSARSYADNRLAQDYQPDLTGSWRGSAGETVDIQRNRARIWGGNGQSCKCVFFLVGQRMIAYSPDTDTVRKYWYKPSGPDRFSLIDEGGNLMSFWRVR